MTEYKETKSLDEKFNSENIENRCMTFWEDNKVYAYDKNA